MQNDTIIALSSPPTRGGLRAIVRLSGPHASPLVAAISSAEARTGYQPDVAIRFASDAAVHGSLLFFRGPRSFTGEDIAELHVPNSPPLLRALIDTLLACAAERGLPARTAEPGEFSARAFFNGKLDLTQAEGIAATINATQQTQLRAAAGLREGALHREIAQLTDRVANLLALIEAGIDFADEEDIHFIDASRLQSELASLISDLRARLAAAIHIDQLGAPPTVVFVGKPNVGKSSLINALTGTQRSIVSPVAGTTRDILAATMQTPQGEIRLLDVPGEEPPTDELRQKMMAAREIALLDADLIVEVVDAAADSSDADASGANAGGADASSAVAADATAPPAAAFSVAQTVSGKNPANPSATSPLRGQADEGVGTTYACPLLRILNKSDLLKTPAPKGTVTVSVKTGQGVAALREKLVALVTNREHAGGERLALNHRHRALLLEAQRTLQKSATFADTATRHPELLAAELRATLDHFGQITGTISPDELLGRIFSQFCIGK